MPKVHQKCAAMFQNTRTKPNVSQKYCKTYFKRIPKILQKHTKYLPAVSQKYPKSIQNASKNAPNNPARQPASQASMPKLRKYTRSTPTICKTYANAIPPKVCKTYAKSNPYIRKINLRYHRYAARLASPAARQPATAQSTSYFDVRLLDRNKDWISTKKKPQGPLARPNFGIHDFF